MYFDYIQVVQCRTSDKGGAQDVTSIYCVTLCYTVLHRVTPYQRVPRVRREARLYGSFILQH